jgi:hypothetical protein
MRMLSFYENRGGKNLSAERKRTLENAKDLLREKEGKAPASKSTSGARKRSTSSGSGRSSHSRRASKSSGKASS